MTSEEVGLCATPWQYIINTGRVDWTVGNITVGVLQVLFDSFIFGITILKTYKHFKTMKYHGERGITHILLYDGEHPMNLKL